MNRVRTFVVTLFTLVSALSVQAGTVGFPFLINPEINSSAPAATLSSHGAVSDGNVWLVTWSDAGSAEVSGIRLDAQGRLLDTVALPIGPNSAGNYATQRYYPVPIWFQNAFWVGWQEYRGTGVRDVFGRRMNSDGGFIDPVPFRMETNTYNTYYPNFCSGGTNVLMTWSGYLSGYRIWAQPLSPDGERVGSSTSVVSGLSGYTRPSMAFGDFTSGQKSYLLTYSYNYNIMGVRVSEGGVLLDADPLAICTNAGTQYGAMPVFGTGPGGTQGWWVVWTDARYGDDAIFGAFVSQDGTASHSATGMPLIVGENDQSNPSICWDGTRYLLGWYDYRDPPAIRASVMDTEGCFADTNGTLVSTNEQFDPYVYARTDGSFLAVHGYDSVFIETITAQGSTLTVGTQRLVSVVGAYERYNSGACDGTNYWVAFESHPEEIERIGDIAVQRVAADGALSFSSPVWICTNSADQNIPALAVGKDAVYVVWTDERNTRDQVWGQLLTLDGQLIGTNLQIGASTLYAYFADVASDGTNALTVWSDAGDDRMQGRFLYPNGSMSGVITPLNYDISDPFVTFGGGCYLILAVNNDSPNYLRFRRYRPDETAIDGGSSNLYTTTTYGCWEPQAAYNPDNGQFLVSWRDQTTYQMLARTLDAETAALGNVITTLVINTWGSSENCAMTYDGSNWLCLFRDTRGGPNSLYGVRVDSSGTVLDSTPFPVLYGGSFGELIPPVAPLTNTLILGSKQVYDVDGCRYNTRKNLGFFWHPGDMAVPGQDVACDSVRIDSSMQTVFSFKQSMPASTNYTVEISGSLSDQDWQPVTNCAILDSGVAVSATWLESGGTPTQRYFRAIGQ